MMLIYTVAETTPPQPSDCYVICALPREMEDQSMIACLSHTDMFNSEKRMSPK